MTSHSSRVYETRHLHPLLIMCCIGFFFILLFVLFGNQLEKKPTPDMKVYTQQAPSKKVVEPRFDRTPQQRVGPYRYTSEFMKISFDVPKGYTVQEKINLILIKKTNDPSPKISISSNPSQFENLDGYFNYMRKRNNYDIVSLNKNSSVQYSVNIAGVTSRRIIFMYINKNVVTISALDKKYYSTIDSIASHIKPNNP